MDYTLDTNAAKQADNINARIDQSGKYVGTFTRAEKTVSTKGTKGVDFSFKSETGATADYLTIWTHNAAGEPLHGFKVLMAIMTCLRVKSLSAAQGEVEKYDQASKSRIKVTVPLFQDLMHKPIGLLLQMEEYEKTTGGTAWKPTIFAAFDKDEFTASEILNKAVKPETLGRMVQSLKDRPLKVTSAPAQASAPSGFADFADDVPF